MFHVSFLKTFEIKMQLLVLLGYQKHLQLAPEFVSNFKHSPKLQY